MAVDRRAEEKKKIVILLSLYRDAVVFTVTTAVYRVQPQVKYILFLIYFSAQTFKHNNNH